jgi:hypothetical protein
MGYRSIFQFETGGKNMATTKKAAKKAPAKKAAAKKAPAKKGCCCGCKGKKA